MAEIERENSVLGEFQYEMYRAIAKYPDCVHLPNGTPAHPLAEWTETQTRDRCNQAYAEGRLTHRHILDEEVAEAFASKTDEHLRKELVQCGAMILKWVLDIDSRKKT